MFAQSAIGIDLLAPCKTYHIAHLIDYALIVLVFGTHHHAPKDTCQSRNHGKCHVIRTQPNYGGYCTAKEGACNTLQKLPPSKTIE